MICYFNKCEHGGVVSVLGTSGIHQGLVSDRLPLGGGSGLTPLLVSPVLHLKDNAEVLDEAHALTWTQAAKVVGCLLIKLHQLSKL